MLEVGARAPIRTITHTGRAHTGRAALAFLWLLPLHAIAQDDALVDRVHQSTFNAIWRSAAWTDRLFGSRLHDSVYQETTGSIAPSLLYDKFDGFQPRVRFQLDVPLPRLNERLHAFIGRVNPDEYVTESEPESGALAQQYGPVEEDDTLLGIRYREPRQGDHFSADAGVRLRWPLDPYVKGSYRFNAGDAARTLFRFRETVFWQESEGAGFTSRVDIERLLRDTWLLRWTTSGTLTQRSEGVRGYSALLLLRGLPKQRALAAELFTEGELDADVPVGNYGLKLAYRRSLTRDWLILETRVSLTYPKDLPEQRREATWGIGIGLEMFFGTGQYLARPVTF